MAPPSEPPSPTHTGGKPLGAGEVTPKRGMRRGVRAKASHILPTTPHTTSQVQPGEGQNICTQQVLNLRQAQGTHLTHHVRAEHLLTENVWNCLPTRNKRNCESQPHPASRPMPHTIRTTVTTAAVTRGSSMMNLPSASNSQRTTNCVMPMIITWKYLQ